MFLSYTNLSIVFINPFIMAENNIAMVLSGTGVNQEHRVNILLPIFNLRVHYSWWINLNITQIHDLIGYIYIFFV